MSSVSVELKQAIISIAGVRQWSDTRESWFARVARKAGVSPRIVRGIFYQEYSNPSAQAVERIRAAAEAAKPESVKHAEKLESAAASLAAIDPDFYGPEIDRLRNTARKLRGSAYRKGACE